MIGPKLIGMVGLPLPRLRKTTTGVEYIKQVAVDVDGQMWGLVMRQEQIKSNGGYTHARLDYVRWVRFDAIAFAPDEVVTHEEWPDGSVTPPPSRRGER